MARSNLKDFSRAAEAAEKPEAVDPEVVDQAPPEIEEALNVREKQALRVVYKNMFWSMGLGLVPVPLIDIAGVAGFQAKALKELSDIYEIPFSEHKIKNVVAIVASGMGTHYFGKFLAGSIARFLPGVGQVATIASVPIMAGALSYAIGKLFIQNFETGGTFFTLKPKAIRAYFREQYEKGLRIAARFRKGDEVYTQSTA